MLGISRTPNETIFGCTARIGLISSNLPNIEIKEIITKKDLDTIIKEPTTDEDKITERNVEFQQNLKIKQKSPCLK